MSARVSPRWSGAGRGPVGLLVGAAVTVLTVAGLLASGLDPNAKRIVSTAGLILGSVVVGASCLHRMGQRPGRPRLAWGAFTVGAGLAAAAYLIELVRPTDHVNPIGPTDALIALSFLAATVGLVWLPKLRRRPSDLARLVLDGLIIGGSIMFLASVTLFPAILRRQLGGGFVLVLPVLDIIIATFAALLILRSAPAVRPMLALAAVGFVCYAVPDFAYAMGGGPGRAPRGHLIDIGWIVGYGLLAIGIRRTPIITPSVAVDPPWPDLLPEASPVLGTTIIFGLFTASTVVSLFGLQRGTLSTPSALLWLLVILGIMSRQTFLLMDNERLREFLEKRVDERSRSLRQVTQQTDLLVDSVGDGIYGVDHEGRITFLNPAGGRTLGFTPETLTGHVAHDSFHALGPDGRRLPIENCYITEAIRDGVTAFAEDDVYVRADGRVIPVEVTTTPIYEDGSATGAVVVFRDMTQRREVDRLKSEFVSVVSHELRTPLTAIRGSLGLIAGGAVGELSSHAQRMVDIALVSSERLTRLVNDILDIERIEAGAVEMGLSEESAAKLINSAVDQVQVLASEEGVYVVVQRADGVIYANPDRVIQTLLNVVGNAIKFSPAGSTVHLGSDCAGDFVEFWVADRGRGIPEDKLQRIFGRFEQVDSSDARDKGGSGLGLAISHRIVEQLGGRIWAQNNPGGGATFRFTLPTAPSSNPSASPGRAG